MDDGKHKRKKWRYQKARYIVKKMLSGKLSGRSSEKSRPDVDGFCGFADLCQDYNRPLPNIAATFFHHERFQLEQ